MDVYDPPANFHPPGIEIKETISMSDGIRDVYVIWDKMFGVVLRMSCGLEGSEVANYIAQIKVATFIDPGL